MAVNSTVPMINVTPQTPTGHPVNKPYSILDLNFKQLYRIVEAVQNMKDAKVSPLLVNISTMKNSDQYARISSSCPSLNEMNVNVDNIENHFTFSPSHGDRSSSLTTPCISGHPCKQRWSKNRKSRSGRIACSLNSEETLRRRSWAALEDLSTQQEMDRENISKRRSVSFSSPESDTEVDGCNKVEYDESTKKSTHLHSLPLVSSNGSTTSSISTHSLNEGDVFYDFINVRLKRENDSHSLGPAIPVHKSVSTPSVHGAAICDSSSDLSSAHERFENVEDTYTSANTSRVPAQRPSGTESETEEEMLISTLREQRHRRYPFDEIESNASYINKSATDHCSMINSFTFEDRPKIRKRGGGSLFFRKKKEKAKKDSGAHTWKSNIHQNSNRAVLCDWCSKPVEMKYTQRCSSCQLVVHEGVCVQHISFTECKPKPSSKVTEKRTPQQPVNKCNSKKNSNLIPMVVAVGQSNNSAIGRGENSDFIKNQQSRENQQHIIDYPEEVPLIAQEFLNEEQVGPGDLDTDPFLGLQDEEPDTWTPNVSKEILKTLKEKEIKRQEHIYEFVLTEKHHCLTLILMQKIFVDGLKKHFQLGPNLHRMFPRLAELTEIHLKFLYDLRKRQREAPVVETISDILLEQFSGNAADKLKAVYGEFCSRHRESVDIYKYYLSENAAFSAFVKHCQNNPLLKKKGIPECILFVTQRLTKYPLLIEPLIKTSKENKSETDLLSRALALVRHILIEVDMRVAEKEKEERRVEIYNKIDPKSWTTYRGNRFKRSDIIINGRKLIFEGQAQLVQSRTKLQLVYVIVLSDVLFFLVENSNNKFAFYTPEDKAGVISLQKLLVREQAGTDSRSIFLISSNPLDPEMFDLKILKPKDKTVWITSIRLAVQSCPEDDQMLEDDMTEEQRRLILSQSYLNQIVGDLRQKDVEQALIYEEKIALLLKLLSASGVEVGIEHPSYRQLVAQYLDGDTLRKEVLNTVQKVQEITSALYNCGTNLSRSASSVGEHQSNVYVSPILPKRAETFGGFDNSVSCKGFIAGMSNKLSQQFPKKSGNDLYENVRSSSVSPISSPSTSNRKLNTSKSKPSPHYPSNSPKLSSPTPVEIPSIMQLDTEQQSTVVLLTSHIYSLTSIIAQQMSTIESLEAQILLCRQELHHPNSERERKPAYKLNQQLEELRNLQDKLTQEKQQWQRERDAEKKELEEKEQQLHKLQEQVRMEQEDVTEQREQLYRKLEAVSSQGLVNAANPPLLMLPQPPTPPFNAPTSPAPLSMDSSGCGSLASTSLPVPSASSSPFNSWKRHKESFRWNKPPVASASGALPLNLISATNQQKVATNVQIKQKLPLKLAMKPEKSSPNGGGGGGGGGGAGSGASAVGTGGTCVSPGTAGISTTSALSAVSHLCSSSTLQSGSHQKSQHSKGSSFLRKSTPRLLNIKLSSPKDES